MNNTKELIELSDEFYDLICMLEICRGYTQADAPDMVSFDIVLKNMYDSFLVLYERLGCISKEDT